ncbi:jg22766 [Pararge aegeria aegeria]|uniref:Jg22766 protein n=1 Tax=Pararge aegeria aegeria TaxID=348720 RepID=A0A8S4QWP0_9NEOP|nr:jg22766 [Pararge aegeria aegeria]
MRYSLVTAGRTDEWGDSRVLEIGYQFTLWVRNPKNPCTQEHHRIPLGKATIVMYLLTWFPRALSFVAPQHVFKAPPPTCSAMKLNDL